MIGINDLDTPLAELGFSNRTSNVLMHQFSSSVAITLKDIAGLSRQTIQTTPGCGQQVLDEIEVLLGEFNLRLGMSEDALSSIAINSVVPDESGIQSAMFISFYSLSFTVRTVNVINMFFTPESSMHWNGDRSDILQSVAARNPKDILLGDIVCFTDAEYLRAPNFGRKSLNELKAVMESHGLSLGMPYRAWAEHLSSSVFITPPPDPAPQTELNPGLFLKISDIDLSVRTRNGLHNLFSSLNDPNQNDYKRQIYNMILNRSPSKDILLGDVVQFSEAELSRTPNFGRKSLKELKVVLAEHNLCLGMESFAWGNELIEAFFKKNGTALKQNRAALAQVKFDQLLPEGTVYLEDEIASLLVFANLTSERNTNIFIRKTGLDGKGGTTLEEVGSGYGITRERVRQIVNKENKRFMRKLLIHLETYYNIREYLGGIDIKQTETLESELVAMGLTRARFDLNGIFALEELINPESDFFADCEIDRFPQTQKWFFFRGDRKNIAKKILAEINRLSSSQGFIKRGDLTFLLAKLTDAPLKTDEMDVLLEAIGDKQFLNKERTSFFIIGNRNRLANAVLKCLHINRPLKPARIKDGLRRHTRLNRIPSTSELLEFCMCHPDFTVVGGKIDTHIDLIPDEIFSGAEFFLVDAFKDGSVTLTFEELKARCLPAGMNLVTFYLYTKNSPYLESDGNGRFALRGCQEDPFNLDMSTATFTGDNSLALLHNLNEAQTDDGHYWISFELNEAIIENGAFIPPLTLKELTGETHNIEGYNHQLYGKTVLLSQGLSGFKAAFEESGAEPGDTVILVRNAFQKRIVIEIGSNDQIERAKLPGLFEQEDNDMVEL